MNLSKYVTTRQAAEMLGTATTHINRLLIDGKLNGIKPGGHDWLVFQPSLEKYLANKSRRGRPTSKTPTIQVHVK